MIRGCASGHRDHTRSTRRIAERKFTSALLPVISTPRLNASGSTASHHNAGHRTSARSMVRRTRLGRVGGLAEEEVMLAWAKGERETVIAKVLHSTEGTLRARESEGH